jgi:serine/threonine protein kinase
MTSPRTEDLLDRLVGEYADRLARGEEGVREALLAAHPGLRDELLRCFRMVEAGRAPAGGELPHAGETLGEFRLLREIGRGGMGLVYLAEQPSLKRRVALKVLRRHLTLEPRHVDRFRREAQAAARLRHPHVVPVFGVGEQDGHHWIAMELVEGPTLADVVARLAAAGRAPTPADLAQQAGDPALAHEPSYAHAVVRLLRPALDGLSAAHAAGLVHRDVKPGNILLARGGRPLVADFGLAKGEGDLALSLSGEPLGTPYYMSPEQADAARREVDARTDVYSAGVVLYELLTLKRPFEGRTSVEVLSRILHEAPPRPAAVSGALPRGLEAVVLKAMAKRPQDRYASIDELSADLQRVLDGEPVRARAPAAWRDALAAIFLPGLGRNRSEWRSATTLWGWPLLHVATGVDPATGRARVARGIFAFGNLAVGVVAGGGLSLGVFSFGGLAGGLFAFGGLAAGGVACGGLAVGLVALGGVSAGVVAVGGRAWGWLYALAGEGSARWVIDHARRDPEAVKFFETWAPWVMRRLLGGG